MEKKYITQKFNTNPVLSRLTPIMFTVLVFGNSLADGEPLWKVQDKVKSILNNSLIIGHGLENDFEGENKCNMFMGITNALTCMGSGGETVEQTLNVATSSKFCINNFSRLKFKARCTLQRRMQL
ncbi:unnamed protein product [Allacma fusca]|uniref:Uncharacterized protein n=1 Tax=Allacma fusca TaxID=39272 RepID=A0A8J2K595_9HEXA|nr:unnamed protein product [Allacma fusca]